MSGLLVGRGEAFDIITLALALTAAEVKEEENDVETLLRSMATEHVEILIADHDRLDEWRARLGSDGEPIMTLMPERSPLSDAVRFMLQRTGVLYKGPLVLSPEIGQIYVDHPGPERERRAYAGAACTACGLALPCLPHRVEGGRFVPTYLFFERCPLCGGAVRAPMT
jgi:hypothetical protein